MAYRHLSRRCRTTTALANDSHSHNLEVHHTLMVQFPSVKFCSLNLKAAVEREKAVQAIDVHRECKNCVVTFWVMSQLLHFLGASRGCADFRDPTAVFRLKETSS